VPEKLKCVTVVGARPQFIKAATVSRALRARSGLREVLVHTGQHYDDNMSKVFFSEMEIQPPDHNLGVGSASHGAQTGQMLAAIEVILLAEPPDCVLIYGDTNSTLAGALAACKLHIPVAHVEAGLRSFNRRMPEEMNRILADHAADLLFAPTETAVANLAREGIAGAKVINVGDVMYDAALFYGERAERDSRVLDRVGVAGVPYVLATVHRAENTDDPRRLRTILAALAGVAAQLPVVLPLHPRTRATLAREGLTDLVGQLRVIDPVGYLDMVMLERHASLVVTDSGGVQKEAFFHGVPCVTLRDETEWVELVELGWNTLAPPLPGADLAPTILAALGSRGRAAEPYGQGRSAAAIVEHLIGTWGEAA
jgi:UDP-GlcNAc3NAcA epimerase